MDMCKKMAKFDKIDELDDKMTDKKWRDMKNMDFWEKLEFWQEKYKTWDNEDDKMKAMVCSNAFTSTFLSNFNFRVLIFVLQKNMCILITEDEKKTEYKERAQKAGLKDDEFKPMADMMWKMRSAKSIGEEKSIMVTIRIMFSICTFIKFFLFSFETIDEPLRQIGARRYDAYVVSRSRYR